MMEYNVLQPWKTLEPWQKEVLGTEGNIVLRSGRQVGKSTVISVKAGDFALNNPNKEVLVIAAVERQAYLLFHKILEYIRSEYPKQIKGRATMTFVEFKNGSKIRCLPAGLTGDGIRGYTIDLLIADEAAFISELVWTAVTPMLAITRGSMILLSTPHGKGGFYYKCFEDPTFTPFHVSSEDCPRKDEDFLEAEKIRLGKIKYSQEYLGEFMDELSQLFPTELIIECMSKERRPNVIKGRYYLGVDIARMGEDLTTFEIIDMMSREKLVHVENITKSEQKITDTIRTILNLDNLYNFKGILIDDGGMGVGVYDMLLENRQTRRKIKATYSLFRPLTRDEKERKKTVKEDLYMNLRSLMTQHKISLLKDDDIFHSLKSIQFEHVDGGKTRIHGDDAHIADGLVRAAWCSKDKSLNIYIY